MFVRATAASGTLEGAEKQRYLPRAMVRRGDVSKRRGSCINEQRRAEQHSNEQLHFIPLIRTNGVKQVGGAVVCCEWRRIHGFDPANL